jgi:predicted carbohydrate-binding protein with CBM5 and CBM33 domain
VVGTKNKLIKTSRASPSSCILTSKPASTQPSHPLVLLYSNLRTVTSASIFVDNSHHNTMAPSSQRTLALLALGLLYTPQYVSAHGWITTPPSRQASCADKSVEEPYCDGVTYEPQSVESPKGAPFQTDVGEHICNGGGSRFAALDTTGAGIWPQTSIPASQDLNIEWKITVGHKTQNWIYYITKPELELDPSQPLTKADFLEEPILLLDTDTSAPPAAVSHVIPSEGFSNHSGYAVILGVWTIGDTGNAFYNCLDVNFEIDGAAPAAEEPPVKTPPPTTTSSSNTTTAAPTTMATSTTVLLDTAVSGTAVYGTAVSGTAAATGSMSTATGVANVGYDSSSNSTVLTLHDRRVRRAFFA